MAGNNQYKAQHFIEAIPGSAGIKSTIAKRVGCDWHTADKYINSYPTVKLAYDDECAKQLDMAEAVVLQGLRESDLPTAKWYLTMKGSDRGYVPKEARQLEGDVTIRVVWDDD